MILAIYYSKKEGGNMQVFINPGHSPKGDPDPGAVNEELDLEESSIAEHVGELVKGYLEAAGLKVRILQSDNLMGEGVGPCVTGEANDWPADVFVSLHCNAASGRARGVEALCYQAGGAAEALAKCLERQVFQTLSAIDAGFPSRGIKLRPDLAVLRETQMPAVLVEMGFIDNQEDAWLLTKYADDIARAIARGVTDYAGALH